MIEEQIENLDELLSHGHETASVAMTIADIVQAMRTGGEFFIQFFLSTELEFKIPEFHLKAWALMTTAAIEYCALALPRGHAKTTLAKLAAVWYYLFTNFRFIIYVSNTASTAASAVKDIANYIRSENFEMIFGKPEFVVEQDQRGYYEFYINCPQKDGSLRRKLCILKSIGAGQQIRGTNIDNERPQLAIVDDLEDDDNTATPLLIRKLRKWFYGPFIKALSRKYRKIIFIGNMLSTQSLLYSFIHRSTRWFSMLYGCILSDGAPLWPDMWSLEAIRADFIEYQQEGLTAQWFSEMMNMPIVEGSGLIKSEEISYSEPLLPGEQEAAFITVDPAVSQKTYSDETSICVNALKNGMWRSGVEVIHGHFTPDQIFYIIVDLCMKWNTRCVGIELAAFQMLFKYLFSMLMHQNNFTFEIFEVPHKNKPKLERLLTYCAYLRRKLWTLQEGDFIITQQLLAYDPTKNNNKDDVIDSASMGITMVDMYLPAIMSTFDPDPQRLAITSGVKVMPC